MQRMTTAEAVVATLGGHGIDTVYGVPGVHNDALFDAIYNTGGQVRMLHARHEQTGAYMALGAALATGRPQAYAAVPGPGVLNTTAALLTAWGMEAPVLALCGQVPAHAIDRGFGHLHEIPDQLGLLGHLTKHAARITGRTRPAPAPPTRCAWRCPAGGGRWRWNARSTCGTRPGPCIWCRRSRPWCRRWTTRRWTGWRGCWRPRCGR